MDGYIPRVVVRETEKAYLVQIPVNNRRDGNHINHKWVAKSICKPYDIPGVTVIKMVNVPEDVIGSGTW